MRLSWERKQNWFCGFKFPVNAPSAAPTRSVDDFSIVYKSIAKIKFALRWRAGVSSLVNYSFSSAQSFVFILIVFVKRKRRKGKVGTESDSRVETFTSGILILEIS